MHAKTQSVPIMQRNLNIYLLARTVALPVGPTSAAKLVELMEQKFLQSRNLNKFAIRSQTLAHRD
jgi:hypothetical protein